MHYSSMVDWSALPADLLHLISQHLPTSTDRLRFRSVCHIWRAAAPPPPPAASSRFLPSSINSGFHLSKRTVFLLQPSLPGQSSWIIKLAFSDPHRMHLVHPIRGFRFYYFRTVLPGLLDFSNIRVRELVEEYRVEFNSRYLSEHWYLHKKKVVILNNVVLAIHISQKLMVHKFGDGNEKWSIIHDDSAYDDIILWGGKVYAVDTKGKTVVVNCEDFKVSVVANAIKARGDRKFFVSCDKELLLVDMCFGSDSVMVMSERCLKMNVYRLESKWREITDLGDKVIFLGSNCTFIAAAAEVFGDDPSKGNCIFYKHKTWNTCYVGAYNLKSGCLGPIFSGILCPKIFWPPPPWVF